MRGMLTLAAVVGAAVIFMPAKALGQQQAVPAPKCNWSCLCNDAGCACSNSQGGTGLSCEITGSGCLVKACPTQQAAPGVILALDGSVVELDQIAPRLVAAGTPLLASQPAAFPLSAWEYAGEGFSVVRNCRGVVIAQSYTPERAAAIRAESRRLVL